MLYSRWGYYASSIPTLFFGIKNWARVLFELARRRASVFVELRDGLRLHVRSPMDVWIIKENCLDRQYESAGAEIVDGWTVLDIGAGLGDFAISVAKRNPQSLIYAYEPYPESFELMRENIKLNGISNVRAFLCAVSAHGRDLEMSLAAHAVEHTTVSGASDNSRKVLTVPSVTLEQVLETMRSATCDYMKMDCEGAEFEIFTALSPQTLSRINRICLEYHDTASSYTHNDLVRLFEKNGYCVKCFPNPVHAYLGLMYAEK